MWRHENSILPLFWFCSEFWKKHYEIASTDKVQLDLTSIDRDIGN